MRLLVTAAVCCWTMVVSGCVRPSARDLEATPASKPSTPVPWSGDDAWVGSGWASCEDKTRCSAKVTATSQGGRGDQRSLRLQVTDGTDAVFGWHPASAVKGIDIRNYNALSFWVRIAEASEKWELRQLEVGLLGAGQTMTATTSIGARPHRVVDGWHHALVPLRDLEPLAPLDVTGVRFVVKNPDAGALVLEVDDLEFVRLDHVALHARRDAANESPPDPNQCSTITELTCVESPPVDEACIAWNAETGRQLEEALPNLQGCLEGREWREAVELVVSTGFSESGEPKGWWVPASTTKDCELLSCVTSSLASFRAPPPRSCKWTFRTHLSAAPKMSGGWRLGTEKELVRFMARAIARNECTDTATALPRRHLALKPEVIQEVVRSASDKFRACYEVGLARNRNLCGYLQVRFTILKDGTVQQGTLTYQTTLPDCEVARCIRQHYSELRFPPPDGEEVTVVYPVLFQPQ